MEYLQQVTEASLGLGKSGVPLYGNVGGGPVKWSFDGSEGHLHPS